jgi:hypothetical protein
MEISSDGVDLAAVADALEERRWFINRQPGGLHLMLSPVHDRVMDELLEALAASVAEVQGGRATAGVSPRYA